MKLDNVLYLIDPDIGYKLIGTLDNHVKSFNWTEEMLSEEGGSFSIVLHGGTLKPILKKELFVLNTKGFKLGFITSIKYKKNRGVIEEITISGKMAEHILTRRTVKQQMQLKGTIKSIITDLINRNVVSTETSILNIPMTLKFIGTLDTAEYEYAFEDGEKVSAAMNSICLNMNMLYYFTIENNGLVLNVKVCEDKSHILFASDDSNIYDITILDSIEKKANCIRVKGDIINNSVPYSYAVLAGQTDIHVIEEFVDSSNVDSKDIESSLYLKMLRKVGNNKLMNYQIRRCFDAATLKNKYRYPSEIALGDIVSIDVEDEREKQRLTTFAHCVNGNNKEEIIFTLTQMPDVIVETEGDIVYGDISEEDRAEIESDATTENINPDATGGGNGGAEIIGRVLCIDDPRVDGTIEKLGKGLYRVNIYTWNANPSVTVEGSDEVSEAVVPYVGKLYFECDFDILGLISNDTNTVDLDNFDASKTRINIASANKGVLYRDRLTAGYPLVFENPTAQNADDSMWYEYDIDSENLNLNASLIISETPVKDDIPLKTYSTTYRIPLGSSKKTSGSSSGITFSDTFIPDNFTADEGDYIKLVANYAPIVHTNDPTTPYVIQKDKLSEIELIWTFRKGEKVANKYITLPEGYYDFVNNNNWGFTAYFQKLEHIKTSQTGTYSLAAAYDTVQIKRWYSTQNKYIDISVNGYAIIKQDPAFDSIDELIEPQWGLFEINAGNYTVNMAASWPLGVFLCTQIAKMGSDPVDPTNSLYDFCENPGTWSSIYFPQS